MHCIVCGYRVDNATVTVAAVQGYCNIHLDCLDTWNKIYEERKQYERDKVRFLQNGKES